LVRVVCEWDLAGIEAWKERADVFVIVDVLSFSTSVSVALDRGATVIPFPHGDAAAAERAAARLGAVAASKDRTLTPSLSPSSLRNLPANTRLLLPSPNGSRLSLATGSTPTFCAGLRNAQATAAAARRTAGAEGMIAVIPAGERWGDGSLRPALEDWLGAGAVVAALGGIPNAEAELAAFAFARALKRLGDMIRTSRSGLELSERGFAADLDIALEIDSSRTAPRLVDGQYSNDAPPGSSTPEAP